MQYEFLKQFPKRMKHVGMYALLIQNSMQKQIWKQYGLINLDEQMNMIFSVMLYIMEQSLKEEVCTIDDISTYIDDINVNYLGKNMSYEDCRNLGDFIINVVLCNEGKEMYFDCFDYENKAYKNENIRYVANKIVYLDSDMKRTSYYLTDDGYNLLLSTLEIENNMKLTIHEMIFKMQLEKQSYDKALDEIKNVFNQLRIQLQKIQEAMLRIRRNALRYSVADYESIQLENMETIEDTKKRFQGYRENVCQRMKELEEQNINVDKLSAEEEENLNNLRQIESYLNRSIEQHQKILNSHFDLKTLYEKELKLLAQMSRIQRFSLRTELYDKLLENPESIENLDYFFRPLLHQDIDKIYNLNKALELQRPIRKKQEDEEEETLDFDEGQWQEELERKQKEKLLKYEKSLEYIMTLVSENNSLTLKELESRIGDDEDAKAVCIPSIDIFKEIMVELIKSKEIKIDELKKERSEFIVETSNEFQLQEMILQMIDNNKKFRDVKVIRVRKIAGAQPVAFGKVMDDNGNEKTIRCSDVEIIFE